MKRVFYFFFITVFMYGIEIEIRPDKKIKVQSGDISAMKHYLKKRYRFVVEDKGARQLVEENRILANEYLKSPYFKSFDRNFFKIKTERELADKFVELLQREIKIPQEAVKSYYYDHLDEFKEPPKAYLVRYSFPTYEEALRFYQDKKKNPNISIKEYKGIKRDIGFASIPRFKEPLKSLVEKHGAGYLTPPFIWAPDRYDVYYVKEIDDKPKYKDFEKVRKQIEEKLHKLTFKKRREEILKKYKNEKK